MFGRPVLLSIAAAAIGSVLSVTAASASCYSCGCGTPVVYSYTYASPCAPRMYYLPPMYVVNQGPAYTLPVPIAAEPTPVYPYVGVRSYGATAYADEGDEAEVYPREAERARMAAQAVWMLDETGIDFSRATPARTWLK